MARARGSWLLAVLLLAGLAFFLWRAPRGAGEPRAAPDLAGPPATAPARTADVSELAPARVEIESRPSAVSPAPPARAELRGIVRAGNGTPLEGASVQVFRPAFRGFDLRGGAPEDEPEQVSEVQSDTRGEFRVALSPGDRVDLEARREGLCPARAVDRGAGEFVELVLLTGLRVRGRITRARDGAPVAGARVGIQAPGSPLLLPETTVSAGDGTYSLRVPAAPTRLKVVPLVEQSSPFLPLSFDAGGECVLDVAVEDGVRVEGRVSARDTGRPLAARVHEGRVGGRSVATDERGEYVLTGFGNPDVGALLASAPGYASARGILGAPVDGRLRVDFELVRGRSARGRVVDERASPVERARVLAVAQDGVNEDWRTGWTGADGSFALADLLPEMRHALLITASGYATQVHDFPADELARAELDLGTFVLRAPRALRGRVVDEGGKGLEGVIVSTRGWNADRFALGRSEEDAAGSHHVAVRERVSDAEGRFAFEDLAPGDYALGARAAGRAAPPEQSVEIAGTDVERKIVLPSGDAIRGVVRDERGLPLASIHVGLSVEELRDPAAALESRSLSLRTKADGVFEFTGLPAGLYALELFPTAYAPEDLHTPLLATNVAHVAAGAAPLEVEMQRGLTIEGVLRDDLGAALAGHSVSAVGAKGEIGWTAWTDAEGRFAMPVARGTTWTLQVYDPGQLEGPPRLALPSVAAGTLDLSIELR